MKPGLLLTALPLLLAAAPAFAQQAQDGCTRLPSAARVIVIQPQGCGLAKLGKESGGPVLVYGVTPSPIEVAQADSSDIVGSITNNVAVSVNRRSRH